MKRELFFFLVFFHLFYCVRGSHVKETCQLCIIFFAKDGTTATALSKEFYPVYICKMYFFKSLYAIFQKDREKYFNIDICYQHWRFLEPGDLNSGWLYSEACRKPCHLLMINHLKQWSEFTSISLKALEILFWIIFSMRSNTRICLMLDILENFAWEN